jgi:hypothetical protein
MPALGRESEAAALLTDAQADLRRVLGDDNPHVPDFPTLSRLLDRHRRSSYVTAVDG